MPTALTTSTSREDLLEQAVHMGAAVACGATKDFTTDLTRLAVMTARYLNTLRLEPDTGEEEHSELDTATLRLLDAAVHLGLMALDTTLHHSGQVRSSVLALPSVVSVYLRAANRQHNLSRVDVPNASAPDREALMQPYQPTDTSGLQPAPPTARRARR